MPTYHIETFGCQMNEHDSAGIAGILEGLGLVAAHAAGDAEVVVLNTCSVRDKPHRKAFARLQDLRLLKRTRPGLKVVVAGCMAQLIPDEIGARAPHVDLLVGPGSYAKLAESLAALLDHHGPEAGAEGGQERLLGHCRPDETPIPYARPERLRAWVNVMVGCDNHCAYCVVPRARGPEVSRRPEAVLSEVEQLARDGVIEVTLLGQNVNSYGRGLEPETDFAELLGRLDAVEGLRRVRFTTSHPKDLSPRLVAAMAGLPTVCEHLHLPVQAGSDAVLARMGRGHTAEHYVQLVRAVRTAVPGVAVTTDVMVGFPGETEEDFAGTLALFEEVRFDQAFMFKYDDRPGTPARDLPGKVPGEEKQRRFAQLVRRQNEISLQVNRALVGREFEVLVEGPDAKSPGKLRGRTRQSKLIIFPGDADLVGALVAVRAVEPRLWGWIGERRVTGNGKGLTDDVTRASAGRDAPRGA